MRNIQETYNIDEYPFLKILQEEENRNTILREYDIIKNHLEDWPEKDLYEGEDKKWKFTIFKAYNKWIPDSCSLCPGIFFILDSFGDKLFNAAFSILGSGTELQMHHGEKDVCYNNLRIHYVLHSNKNAGLTINNKKIIQNENDIIIWDDSLYHNGFNLGETDKVVLLLDIERPYDLERGKDGDSNTDEYNNILDYVNLYGVSTNEIYEKILVNNGINCKNSIEFIDYLYKFKINTNIYLEKEIKNILITGSNGFIGINCVKYLNNYNLFCTCRGGEKRFKEYYKDDISENIRIIDIDLSNKEDYYKLPKNIDLIIHTAALDNFKSNINILWKINTMSIIYLMEYYKNIPIIYTNSASIKNYPEMLNKEYNSIHNGYSFSKYMSNIFIKKMIDKGYDIKNYVLGYIYSHDEPITEDNSLEGMFTIISKLEAYPENMNYPFRYFHIYDILPELLNFNTKSGTYELYYSKSKTLEELFPNYKKEDYKIFCKKLEILFKNNPNSIFKYALHLFNDELPILIGRIFEKYGNKIIDKNYDESSIIDIIEKNKDLIFLGKNT
jgi:hypothetical protein